MAASSNASDRRKVAILSFVMRIFMPAMPLQCWSTTTIHASSAGQDDALQLTLTMQVGLELGEYIEQVEGRLAARDAGGHRLLRAQRQDTTLSTRRRNPAAPAVRRGDRIGCRYTVRSWSSVEMRAWPEQAILFRNGLDLGTVSFQIAQTNPIEIEKLS